jgi:hypothetical protein
MPADGMPFAVIGATIRRRGRISVIGIHGHSHENPIAMTPAQEEAVLDKCVDFSPISPADGRPI